MAGADTNKEADAVEDYKADYERHNEAWSETYVAAVDAFKFARLGEQWPENIRRDRELTGRPCLTINKLAPMIRQVVNDARQNKPSITVHPVDDGADPETAEVFNGLIRHIERSSDADVAYDTAIDCSATGGFGYFGINTRYATDDGFEQDIVIEAKPNPFAIIPDTDSTASDSSDWNVAFEIETLTAKRFKKLYPDADPVNFDTRSKVQAMRRDATASQDDVTVAVMWCREEIKRQIVALSAPLMDAPEELVAQALLLTGERMIVSMDVYKANKDLFDALGMSIVGQPRDVPSFKVTQKTLSGADVLKTVDWAGKYIPIIPVFGEDVNIEGKRCISGMVKAAMDPQRMFNYWRSTTTELVALAPRAPFIGRTGAFDTDAAKWASANTQSHAYIEYDGPESPQRQPFAGIPAGALQEALNASDDIKAIVGMYDASLGSRSNETSGRAIMARQREGDVSTFHYIDNLSRAIRHAGRILIDLIPKVYNTERIIRVIGPEGDQDSVRIAPKAEAGEQEPEAEREEDVKAEGEEMARVYVLDAGKYDLTVTAGPSFTSRREEAATQMIELIRAYPAVAPVIGDLLAKNLDWPGADEIAERLKAMLPGQLQGENPEAMAAQAQMKQMAEIIGKLRGDLLAAKSSQDVAARKVEIDAFNAETNRMKAIAPKGVDYDPAMMAPVVMTSLMHILQSPDILDAVQAGADPNELAAMLAQRMAPPTDDQRGMPPEMIAA